MMNTRRETKTIPLTGGLTALLTEVRSGDETAGSYGGGLWHGYELCIRDGGGRTLDMARVESWGYPVGVSVDVAPDGTALAVVVEGDDGFEQADYAVGVFQLDGAGKIRKHYGERREGGRIVTERPRVTWTPDDRVVVEWVVEGTSSPETPDSILLHRFSPEGDSSAA